MPLLFRCVDVRRFDFRGDYITDKQLKRTIDGLVDDTLVAAAAEDVTERILHEALLKAKGGSYTGRFTMTSKKPPQTNSDDEAVVDNDAAALPQGDTPLSPEVIKMVSTISAKDEESPAKCTEKESLEEEIKKMISKISAFEFEPSSGKTVTEGQGDAEVVETAPAAAGEICESQAAPDLLIERTSSEEWGFQESKEDIAAWEEAVELEVQIIDPAYDDENATFYYKEKISPHTSSTESFGCTSMTEYICSETPAEDTEAAPNELQATKHEDSVSTGMTSDELELEGLAICTSMVVDIMSRAEETIIANELSKRNYIESKAAQAVNISKINGNNKHYEINTDILAISETPTEINSPIMNITERSSAEVIYTETSNYESEEDDLYDIESISVHSENILNLNPRGVSAVCNSQISTQKVLTPDSQKESIVDELEDYKNTENDNTTEHVFKNTMETTASNPSVHSLDVSSGEAKSMTTTAGHDICPADSKVEKPLSVKETEFSGVTAVKSRNDAEINPVYLSANNGHVKEHLESFISPTNTNYTIGDRVQSCDDVFIRTAEESDSRDLLDNTFGRTEVPPKASLRSLDSLSEVYYKTTGSEEIKYQSVQRDKLSHSTNINKTASPILKHKDSNENGLLIHNELTEDTTLVSSNQAEECGGNESHSHALKVFEKKDITTADASTSEASDTTELYASISTIINKGFEASEMAKSDEVIYKRTLSNQNLMHASSHSTQEDNKMYERSEHYLDIPFRYSQEYKTIRRSPRDRSNKLHLTSERKTKTNNLQRPSSSRDGRDGRDAKKKNDIDSNLYSLKKVTPGETPNGKVCKTWKFGSKIKKLIASIKRKL